MRTDDLAMQAHETGRAVYSGFSLMSLPAWTELEDDDRKMQIAITKEAIKNRKIDGTAYHKLWSEALSAMGWVIGPAPDAETKQHPGLVSYDKLPAHERQRCAVQSHLIRVSVHLIDDTAKEPKAEAQNAAKK